MQAIANPVMKNHRSKRNIMIIFFKKIVVFVGVTVCGLVCIIIECIQGR